MADKDKRPETGVRGLQQGEKQALNSYQGPSSQKKKTTPPPSKPSKPKK